MRWLVARAAFFLCFFLSASAFAQGNMTASGTFTPGHTVRCQDSSCTTTTDAGGAGGSQRPGQNYLSELGLMGTGLNLCDYTALTDNPGGYYRLCLGANVNGGGALFSFDAMGAPPLPWQVELNGQFYPFPPTGNGNILGPNTSVVGHFVLWNNTAGTLAKDTAGLGVIAGDNTGAVNNAAGFAAQITAGAAAGGEALIIPEGNWRLDTTVGDTSGLVGFLALPGAVFSGAGGLLGVTDPAINTPGWGSFSFLRNEAGIGTNAAGSANQMNVHVSTNIPLTNSAASYEKIGIYSRMATADPSTWTQNVGAGIYTPLIFRDAVGGDFQTSTSTVNAKIFGLHAQCILNADAWCHAVEAQVDNHSAVTQSYLTQPDSMVGVQIVSMNNPITAYLYAGGAANSVDGLVVQADTVTRNVLAAYINPGSKQTTPFRLLAPIGGGGMHLSLSGQITAGYTIPAPGTTPIAVLDCCNFLGHFGVNVNLALGAVGGITGHYAIRGTTDDGLTGVPIDIISDLFVTQAKSGAGLGQTIWNTAATGTTATTSALTVQTGAGISAKYVQFVQDDSGAAYLQVGSGTTTFTLFPATIQFPNLPTVAAGTGKRLACLDPATGKLYAGTGVSCS